MRFRKIVVEGVTVVKFRVDNRGSDGSHYCHVFESNKVENVASPFLFGLKLFRTWPKPLKLLGNGGGDFCVVVACLGVAVVFGGYVRINCPYISFLFLIELW